MKPDFLLTGGGSLYVLQPFTRAGREWIDEHIAPDAQRWGRGVAIEHRYVDEIITGIVNDGLTVR